MSDIILRYFYKENQSKLDLLKLIIDYLDLLILFVENISKTYYNLLKKLFKISFISKNRLTILNNKINIYQDKNYICNEININSNKIYDIIYDEIDTKKINKTIFNIINNTFIQKFLIHLLETELFFIGGSFALIFAYLIFDKDINMETYKDFDIDIFPIGIMASYKSNIIQTKLQSIINEFFIKNNLENIECFIIIKNFVINICFPKILNIPKIQIILHNKDTINEHIAFIDLPITHFTIGKNKIYYTEIAKYAINNNICIIDNVYNKQTYNRIYKYITRGFFIVKTGKYNVGLSLNQQIIAVYSKYYIYKVDCFLSDIIKLQYNIKNNILKNKPYTTRIFTIISRSPIKKLLLTTTEHINLVKRDEICMYLYDMNLLKYNIDNINNDINCYRYKLEDGIKNEHNEYEHFGYDILLSKKTITYQYNITKKNRYSYIYNERNYSHSYEKYLEKYENNKKNKLFPYFTILKPQDFIKIKKNIFFTVYNSYFLNSHKIKFTINDKYSHILSNEKEKKIYIPNWKHYAPITDDEGFILVKKK